MPALSKGERARLREQGRRATWPALRRLAPSFAGLTDAEARTAYLVATAAAAWVEARTDRAARARLLSLLGQGRSADDALRAVVGVDTDGLDAALRREVAAEFGP